jgi:hypothetical protein
MPTPGASIRCELLEWQERAPGDRLNVRQRGRPGSEARMLVGVQLRLSR